jgi:FkbM family methyltransferase
MLKNLVRSCVRPFGIDIVSYPRLSSLAVQLRDLVRTNGVNLILDVGACDGGFVRFLRGPVGYRGKIISFEPTNDTFRMLCENLRADKNWRGCNVGIGDADSEGIINTYGNNRDFNSILSLRGDSARSYGVNLASKSEQPIKIRTIDGLWGDLVEDIPDPIVYLKTDTQGHDPAVIRGATPRLKHIVAIQTELPALQLYDGMQSLPDSLKSMASLEYVPYGFHPVNQLKEMNGMTPEYDVVFIRSDLIRS